MKCILAALYVTTVGGFSLTDWRPLGQGDPLSDPTHVYSPPVVEHVHYWLEPRHRPRVELPGVTQTAPLGFSHSPHRTVFHHASPVGVKIHFEDDAADGQEFHHVPTNLGHTTPAQDFRQEVQKDRVIYQAAAGPESSPIKELLQHEDRPIQSNLAHKQLTMTTSPQLFHRPLSVVKYPNGADGPTLSLSLRPPPSQATSLSQVAGWPQLSTHLKPTFRQPPPVTTTVPTPKQFSTTADPSSTTTSTTTTSKPPTSLPTLSLVIEGHSKVKKYGPLPESANSIHSVNHNHLTSKKVCDHCLDLPVAKLKEIKSL